MTKRSRFDKLSPAERLERIVQHCEAEFREVGIHDPPVAEIMRLASGYDPKFPMVYVAKQVFRRLNPEPIYLEEDHD